MAIMGPVHSNPGASREPLKEKIKKHSYSNTIILSPLCLASLINLFLLTIPDPVTKLWLALERDGEIIASSKTVKSIDDLKSISIKTEGLKTEETLSEKHSVIKEAYRGDILRVMKTVEAEKLGRDIGKSIFQYNQ